MAILLEDAGDRAGELRALDAAARLMDGIGNEPVFLTARTGTWYARAGAFPQAQHIRRKLQPLVNDRQEDQSADLHQLDGEIAAARGDYKTAAVLLSLANRESPNTMALQPLARVHAAAGDRAQALASYQQLIAAGGRTLGWEPQQAWLDAHVCAAELYLERGDRERARQALAPVAALWKDADPALPLARRIAKLRQELRPR